METASPYFPEVARYGGINGANDLGDLDGIPDWAIQVKNVSVPNLGKFVADAVTQAGRAGKKYAGVMLKLRGKHMRKGLFIMPNEQAMRIMKRLEDCEHGACRKED
ncbi:hypothetical protein ACFY2K_26135 [Kitasatospora sp. NPDC001309]|uniref:hypothetical protein n=1 Tax=Kitasatospora sp. NPDC001309 TaxID=3364013 RepID=UPI00367DA3B1